MATAADTIWSNVRSGGSGDGRQLQAATAAGNFASTSVGFHIAYESCRGDLLQPIAAVPAFGEAKPVRPRALSHGVRRTKILAIRPSSACARARMEVSNSSGVPHVFLTHQRQECFAVRPDVDGMLDVARKTFLQSMEDIYQTADSMTEENGYHVKVVMRVRLCWHFPVHVCELL